MAEDKKEEIIYYPMSKEAIEYGKKYIAKYWPETKKFDEIHRARIEVAIQCLQIVQHREDKTPELALKEFIHWLHYAE